MGPSAKGNGPPAPKQDSAGSNNDLGSEETSSAPLDWYAGDRACTTERAEIAQGWNRTLDDQEKDFHQPAVKLLSSSLAAVSQRLQSPWTRPFVIQLALDPLVGCYWFHSSAKETEGSDPIKIVLVNLGDAEKPGGKFLEGSGAHEGSICIRTSLFATLKAETDPPLYPILDNELLLSRDIFVAGLYPGIIEHGLEGLKIDVITCTAPKRPDMRTKCWDNVQPPIMAEDYAKEADRECMVNKIRWIMRAAVQIGATHVVMGPFGCGQNRNPHYGVASAMKQVLIDDLDTEDWRAGGVQQVMIAIKDKDVSGYSTWPAFEDIFRLSPAAAVDYDGSEVLRMFHS